MPGLVYKLPTSIHVQFLPVESYHFNNSSHWCQEWDPRISMALSDTRVVRVSARPPSKFSAAADFMLWIQRFEIYLAEAEIPAAKRARELLSLLEDGPFRVVTQLGLVNSDDYDGLKDQLQKHYAPKGDDLEWQYRLQNRRQKPGEPLSEFVGELRMMTDKAYSDWAPKQ